MDQETCQASVLVYLASVQIHIGCFVGASSSPTEGRNAQCIVKMAQAVDGQRVAQLWIHIWALSIQDS